MVDHAQSRPRAVGPAAAVSRVRHWRVPSAQRSLGFSDESRQWAVTLYALAFG
jgi:hypothetical protein